MLKCLAIFAVLLAVLPKPVPGQTAASAGNSGSKANGNGQSNNGASAPSVTVSDSAQPPKDATHAGEIGAKETQHSVTLTSVPPLTINDKKKSFLDYVYDWGPWFFGLFLAIAGGVQLRLLRITWKAIQEQKGEMATQTGVLRDSVAAAQTSANAALKTVQVMIDSERPWVIAHMEQSKSSCLLDNGNVRFTWTIKNVGKSPAKLIEAGAMVSLDTMGPSLEQIQYKMELLDERILVPGDSSPLFVFWSIVENGRIRTRLGKTLEEFNDLAIVYGCIRYRSAINTPDIYETRFSETSSISGGICDGFKLLWPTDPEDIRCT